MICDKCAACCKLFLVNLTEEEYKSGTYATQFSEMGITEDFIEAEMCGANILSQNEDGSCIYLRGNACSVHDKKPNSCRNFFCSSKNPDFKGMIMKIREYKENL